ncbi:MAG: hypothetical protein J6X53_05570 [Abditibacteriota bacterium]|nr:hypothetical protein [Abditibacteriota bacterium]
MTVFIAAPGTEKPGPESDVIKQEILSDLRKKLNKDDLDMLFSGVLESPVHGSRGDAWHLSHNVEMLSRSHGTYFSPGWKEDRACRVLYAVCKEYGIPILSTSTDEAAGNGLLNVGYLSQTAAKLKECVESIAGLQEEIGGAADLLEEVNKGAEAVSPWLM